MVLGVRALVGPWRDGGERAARRQPPRPETRAAVRQQGLQFMGSGWTESPGEWTWQAAGEAPRLRPLAEVYG